mgnify:CR=1 FL=1
MGGGRTNRQERSVIEDRDLDASLRRRRKSEVQGQSGSDFLPFRDEGCLSARQKERRRVRCHSLSGKVGDQA